MKSLVSIIVPVYNVEMYIHECVDSILAQSYENFECILVDDESPDHCPEICDEYAVKDSRIRVIHQKNGGIASARNSGIEACSGKYIAFVDSDDSVHPDFISSLINAIERLNAQVACCNYYKWAFINTKIDINFGDGLFYCEGIKIIESAYYSCGPGVVVWNKLYSRKLFEEVKFFEGIWHEDEFFFHHIFLKCDKVALIDRNLYNYRIREGSFMHSPFSTVRFDRCIALYERWFLLYMKGYEKLSKIAANHFYKSVLGTFVNSYSNGIYNSDKEIQLIELLNKLSFDRSNKLSFGKKIKIYLILSRFRVVFYALIRFREIFRTAFK